MIIGDKKPNGKKVSRDEDIWEEVVNSSLKFEKKMRIFRRLRSSNELSFYQTMLDNYM